MWIRNIKRIKNITTFSEKSCPFHKPQVLYPRHDLICLNKQEYSQAFPAVGLNVGHTNIWCALSKTLYLHWYRKVDSQTLIRQHSCGNKDDLMNSGKKKIHRWMEQCDMVEKLASDRKEAWLLRPLDNPESYLNSMIHTFLIYEINKWYLTSDIVLGRKRATISWGPVRPRDTMSWEHQRRIQKWGHI